MIDPWSMVIGLAVTLSEVMSNLVHLYLRHLRAVGYADQTIKDRGYVLHRADRELPYGLDQASVDELEAWFAAQRLKPWSRSKYFADVAGFYAWAVWSEYLDWSPIHQLPRPRVPHSEPRPATEAQLLAALQLARPYRTAVELAAFDGLRAGEISRLCRDDVTPEYLTVLRKGGKTQLLPTHPLVWEAIRDLPPGPVVARRRGGHFNPRGLAHTMSVRLHGIGAPITLHQLRHRFATALLDAGVHIRVVQELLGHASVTSTQVYTQVTDPQRRTAIARLPVPGVGTG